MKCIRCGKEINYNFGTGDMNGNYCKSCWEDFNLEVVSKVLKQKDQQIAELKKALELACDELDELADCCCDCHMDDFVYDNFYDNEKLHDSNYFIEKAKEMLKNDETRTD